MTHQRTGRAAINGGGIAGLALAAGLTRAGWHVDVYERADALPASGTALGMWAPARRALAALGRAAALHDIGVTVRGGEIRTWDDRLLARTGFPRADVVMISRPALLRILAQDLEHALHLGVPAPTLPHLADYDVIVGADGVHSATRAALFGPAADARPLGVTAWRGWIDGPASQTSETWGPGALFGITPRDGGLTNWFAAVRDAPPDPDRTRLRARYRGWRPAVIDVLDRIRPEALLVHELFQAPFLPRYVRGNVVLIGDAAHAMAPNLGRGACEALVDAVTLTRLLTRHPVRTALRRYESTRGPATRAVATASALMGRVATAHRGVRVRDALLTRATRLG